ncbi:MAG: UDP-N-acetylglucosamine 2-epimerase (non-hydrolyzing) [Candidatus Omnitrophota bacterium]
MVVIADKLIRNEMRDPVADLDGMLTGKGGLKLARLKLLSVVGARPNFVKAAPLVREFHKVRNKIEHVLIHTGQHYDAKMSADFFASLKIPPAKINLNVGSGSHGQQTAEIICKFEDVCLSEKPDWVIVYGDVNSTLAAAIVTKKLKIRLAHVEAGLRSFDMDMPEEINRKVTDALSDLLFTHSPEADSNLRREGVPPSKIVRVGNIMIDTLVAERRKIDRRRPYARLGCRPKKYVYITLHRPSNVDDPRVFSEILSRLVKLAEKMPIIFALHPRTQKCLKKVSPGKKILRGRSLIFIGPLSYHDSIKCIKDALFVLTDSGGIQEETAYLGTPCLTLRPNTERAVTIRLGTNKLTSLKTLDYDMARLTKCAGKFTKVAPVPLWDGKTASRIVAAFLRLA